MTLDELKALLEKATRGPWVVDVRWHYRKARDAEENAQHRFRPDFPIGRCAHCADKDKPCVVTETLPLPDGLVHHVRDKSNSGLNVISSDSAHTGIASEGYDSSGGIDCAEDAALIVAAVNALPWLMEKLQEARDLLDEVKDDPHPTGARQWLADVERGCP